MASETSQPQKACFVIMGFGEKTDFQTQRVLDLDKTYRIIIRRAVEDAGLKCIRADDVIHSGVIDKPMYELLLSADVVVADLSTSNANAIYELGVRHALRPNTTIVIAESQFKFPFDVTHLAIRKSNISAKASMPKRRTRFALSCAWRFGRWPTVRNPTARSTRSCRN